MMSKDLDSALEFNKLLIVDLEKLNTRWYNYVLEVHQGVREYPWENKIEKAFYRSGVSGLPYDDVVVESNVPEYFPRANLIKISRDNRDLVEADFGGDQSFWKGLLERSGYNLS